MEQGVEVIAFGLEIGSAPEIPDNCPHTQLAPFGRTDPDIFLPVEEIAMNENFRYATEKYVANIENEMRRHCRIGKVIGKHRHAAGVPDLSKWVPKPPVIPVWPGHDTDWKRSYMAGCGCKVGTACGNAACPHRLVVTC